MSIRAVITLLALLAITAGCSGRNTPNNPDNEQWFCQSNELGDGWECVQDANLAQVPVPTRMPPEPEPEPEPEPVDLDDPLDLDALTAPLERNPDLPADSVTVPGALPEPNPAQTPTETRNPVLTPSATEPDGPATVTNRRSGSVPPPPAMADSTAPSSSPPASPPASPHSSTPASQVPKHIALAYVPSEPTPILQLPADYYALQMLAMSTPEQIEKYIDDNALKGMSGARVENDGKIYYVLIVGIYETYDRAREASQALPPPLNDVEVWIRPLSSLQQAMIRADDLTDTTF